ncbi:MAG TPA: porin family protein, partial [Candidatus Saccharicenans sp.]|nr:porin family protein [Candidatus Saccharicenans sp.]
MKKLSKSLSLVAMTLLLVGLLASPGFSDIKFGVKGGLSLAYLAYKPAPIYNPFGNKAGAVGGISLNLGLASSFSLQPEILYVQKGTKWSETLEGEEFTGKYELDSVEVPLLLNFSFPIAGSSFVPSVYAGPYAGFNTRAKVKVTEAGESYSEDFKDEVKDTEFGLTFGIGLGKKIGHGKIVLDVRYDLGLTNIAEGMAEGESVKNKTWLFMLGY